MAISAKKIWQVIKGFFVAARYESAIQQWGQRSWLPATVQDARFDADSSTRTELVRRSRYWERNSAIANRLMDLFEQFTVGPCGLIVVPNSCDESWNQSASQWWAGWCRYPDLCSLQTISVIQSLIARRWFVDGEAFIHKTYSPDGKKRPRLQLIEAHRIGTPPDKKGQEYDEIVDGVQIDKRTGRPVGYHVLLSESKFNNSVPMQSWGYISAEDMIHVFEPERPGQYRGLPMLYPVMNDLHDLDDLQSYEKQAAKDASIITNVVTNASGEVDPSKLRRTRMVISSQDQSGNATSKQPDQFYQVNLGAHTVVMRNGEKVEQFQSNRPSVAQQEFWDYLTAKICAGVGISKLLVLPQSMQGTVTRADLDVANAFFRSRSQVISNAIQSIYEWVMSWAIAFDQSMDGKPPRDWMKCTIRPPRAVNVDIGRNSSAMIAELEAGTRTFQDIYAESGEDWREQLRQRAQEAAYIQDLSAEFKVPVEQIAQQVKAPQPMPQKTEAEYVPILTH